jgi:O-antigen biosynthesis protein
MRRIALFAHYDPQNRIQRHILHHLTALREVCDEVHFASTAQLSAEELGKLVGLVASHRIMENAGYDFGMWGAMIAALDLRKCDELVLTNSSVFGPMKTLAPTFARMEQKVCDFWALTDSLEFEYHLQSFFLVLRSRLLHSGQVERFFASVLPYRHKWQVIRSYEIGLTHFFLDQGFLPIALASVLMPTLHLGPCNPSIWVPLELMDLGFPYVKVELLRDNPVGVDTAAVRRRMAAEGYPLDLVELERPAPRRRLYGWWNRLRLRLRTWGITARNQTPSRPEILKAYANSAGSGGQ